MSNTYINFLRQCYSMNRSGYPILVSLVALVLLSPVVGLSHTIIESKSALLSNTNVDSPRAAYGVMLEYDPGTSTPGEATLTRNEEITIDYVISNTGDNDDTYDLEITWDDSNNHGWYAASVVQTIFLWSEEQDTITFTFRSPIQGVGCQDNGDGTETCDDMDFSIIATSQNSTSVDSSIDQNLEIDTIYAVDIYLREGSSKSGDRSTSVSYSAQVKNVGKNTDDFLLYIGDTPKDWSGYTSISSVTLNPGQSEDVLLTVNIPNTAAVDEYAVIPFIAQVQEEEYDYIHGYTNTTTSVNNGRTYGVEFTTPDASKRVIPGGQILYSLSVKNTGDGTDSFDLEIEDTMEDNWSSSLSQNDTPNLEPDEVFYIELTIMSPEDSVEDDWSVCNISINSSNREQFGGYLETNTSVRIPVRDLSLTISESTKAGNPNEVVSYSVTLTNDGTDPDDFELSTELCEGCNAWIATLSTYIVEDLENGNSYDLDLYVKVPPSAIDTDSAIIGVKAMSIDDSSATDAVSSTTTVKTVYDSQITTEDNSRLLNPDQSTTFDIKIVNSGNSPESFTAELDSGAPSGWDFGNVLPYSTSDLNPYGGYDQFNLPLTIPMDTNPGFYNFSVNLILDSSGLKVAQLHLSVQIEYFADFSIDIANDHLSGKPGKVHEFDVVIENNANHEDDISLVVDLGGKAADWSYCIGTSCLSSIKVPKGEVKTFKLKITTSPHDLRNDEGLTMVLLGTSGLNDKVVTSKTFKISTNAVYKLDVSTLENRKDGNEGSTIPFLFSITNNGNAKDYVSLPSPDLPVPCIGCPSWDYTYASVKGTSFDLEAGESVDVHLNVIVPETVFGGDNTVKSTVESGQSEEVIYLNFTIFIEEKHNVDIKLSEEPGDVTAGTIGTFRVLFTNKGNTPEIVNISLEGSIISWFDLGKTSVSLEPGRFEEVIIEVKPPIATPSGEVSGVLNVTLVSDSSKSTKITLPLMVLKSDLISTEPEETEEDNLLPGLNLFSVVVVVTLVSFLRRRD